MYFSCGEPEGEYEKLCDFVTLDNRYFLVEDSSVQTTNVCKVNDILEKKKHNVGC